MSEVLWEPPADVRGRSVVGRYLDWLEDHRGLRFERYQDLWQWSVTDLEGFWSSVWDFFGVMGHPPYDRVLDHPTMPGARWFTGARLNYAEHALRPGVEDVIAVVGVSQTRGPDELTGRQLREQVARARAGLAALGVGRGDRVAAYLPNISETLVAFLATASLGAVWSSCAPEFGVRSVVDRFHQIDPAVLLTVDGYRFGAKVVDRMAEAAEIRAALPGLRAAVLVPYLGDGAAPDGMHLWTDVVSQPASLEFEAVPFDHPLYILYSSGTTGLPKPIVHGHGGIVVEHLKALGLHSDLGPGDRFFWFSTTGWMMWNLLVSGLLVGSAVVLFDGSPGHPDLSAQWRMAGETATTYFGTSAPFILSCRKAGIEPAKVADLARLRGVGSTGAPLPAEGFRWIYDAVGPQVQLASVSGGTDVCTAFVGASPLLPVRAGEIPCAYLGAKVEAFDEQGRSVIGQQGELVVTAPMPSMPIGFWGDDDGSRYRATYFADFPGVWRHGDWITITETGSCIITGRSDATLNRAGVRLGTSEFYSVVESIDGVADSLVVHLEDPEGGVGELVLFVVPAAAASATTGTGLEAGLRSQIVEELRRRLSPRHVPDAIHAVSAVPRTLSGKKLEVPVKRILLGEPADRAASRGAMVNPESLHEFEKLARRRAGSGAC